MSEKNEKAGSFSSEATANANNVEDARPRKKSFSDVDPDKLSAAFENPLANIPREQLFAEVDDFVQKYELNEFREDFIKGALVAQNPKGYAGFAELNDDDRRVLEREHTHRWDQTFTLWWLVIMCSMAAAVQGMDETVNNGAQALYLKELNITEERFGSQVDYITGLVVGAPYLCCAVLGCWLTEPMNKLFARRGTIFITCFIAAVASIWEGVANSWVNLFVARFVLGLGIGPKSSTVPVVRPLCHHSALFRGDVC
jgi:hypothetical protein